MPRTRSIAWSQLKLGIVAIVALALVTVLVAAVGGQGGFWWELYPIKLTFLDVQGLKSGAVVRLNGKDVGRVEAVEFVGETIEVTCRVSKDVWSSFTRKGDFRSVSLMRPARRMPWALRSRRISPLLPSRGLTQKKSPSRRAPILGSVANARVATSTS